MLYRKGDVLSRRSVKGGNFIPYDPDDWKAESKFNDEYTRNARKAINEQRTEILKVKQLERTKYL